MEVLRLLYNVAFPIIVLFWSILAFQFSRDDYSIGDFVEVFGGFLGFALLAGLFILETFAIFPFYGVVLALILLTIPVVFVLTLVIIFSDAEKNLIPIAAITLFMFTAIMPWLTIKAERNNYLHCGSLKAHEILLSIEKKEKKIPAMGFLLKLAKSKNYEEELLLNASFSQSYSLAQHLIYNQGADPSFCLPAEKPSFLRKLLPEFLKGLFAVIFTSRVGGNSPLLALMEGYFYPHLFEKTFKNRKRENYPKIAKLLISKGAPINCKDWQGNTPLHLAAKIGEASVVEMLISKGADINAKNKYGWPPLFFAANKKIMTLLMENGASLEGLDLNAPDPSGRTPFYAALAEGRVALAELLIDHGASLGREADLNKKNEQGEIPLHLAVEKGNMRIIKYLIAHGADINAKDKFGWPPLFYSPSEEIFSFLLLKGAKLKGVDLDAKGPNGETPLYRACRLGAVALAEFLINRGADIKEKDENERTPLHAASQSGSTEIAKLLLEKGADVNKEDDYDRTPLYYAAASGKSEVAKLLISHGAAVLAKDENGQTILHAAAQGGLFWLASLCIERGADVNAKDKWGWTPIFYASWKGHLEIIKLLVSKGAWWREAIEGYGFPVSQAAANGHLEIVKYFLSLGFNINAKDKAGWTLLHWAANYNQPEVVEYLLSHGADVSAVNRDGKAPCDLAKVDELKKLLCE